MSRDYTHLDNYLNQLTGDIYPQPPDENHTRWASEFISRIPMDYYSVLDVGCGQGFTYPMFSALGKKWTGITLGDDYRECVNLGLDVYCQDFTFLKMEDNSYDLIFARHVLEHSPMPVLTLMEWRRVSKRYLALVLPSPKRFKYFGRNHYSVMDNSQILWLAARAGWKAALKDYSEEFELRYIFMKDEPRIELMWEREHELEAEYGKI